MFRSFRSHSYRARCAARGALILGGVLSSSAGAATSCPAYVLIDLGALPGAQVSWATALNNLGQTTGVSYTGETWVTPQHGFVHNGQAMNDLGPHGFSATANAINTQGQVAGSISDGADTRPVIWSAGQVIELGNLGVAWAEAKDLNDRGEAVGYSWLPDYAGVHAFVYSNGRIRDLGTLGGGYSYAEAINRWGEVVGGSTLTPDGWENYAFVYRNGRMQALGDFGCTNHYSFASDINDRGEIVGVSQNDCGAIVQQRAFLHRNGQMIDLGDLGGGDAVAQAINNLGQVVGFSITADFNFGHFVWDRGVMRNLQQLIDPASAWTITAVSDINDRGEIAGQAQLSNDAGEFIVHAVVLRPRLQDCR